MLRSAMQRIESYPVDQLHGPLVARRRRFEIARITILWAAVAALFLVLFLAFPKSTWIYSRGISNHLTMAGVAFLIGPVCVALALTAGWQFGMERRVGRWGRPRLELIGDELTLLRNDMVERRVHLDHATVTPGHWAAASGEIAGGLVVLDGGDRIAIGAPDTSLARPGGGGQPDVELTPTDYRALLESLGGAAQ